MDGYDETGAPIGFRYRTLNYAQNVFDGYFFEKNLQGDIIGIWDQNGTKVVSYTYDAWGNVTTSGAGATGIGAKNPFRYRGTTTIRRPAFTICTQDTMIRSGADLSRLTVLKR